MQITGEFLSKDDDVPAELARLFSDLFEYEQARFFNTLAVIVEKWPNRGQGFQWRSMAEHLTPEGLDVIRSMNEHTS